MYLMTKAPCFIQNFLNCHVSLTVVFMFKIWSTTSNILFLHNLCFLKIQPGKEWSVQDLHVVYMCIAHVPLPLTNNVFVQHLSFKVKCIFILLKAEFVSSS